MDDRRGERFGRYEILTELGRGAMGVVYKARDPKINRVVAVKTVSLAGQSPEEEREYRERFFREAEAAGRLSHPGIVTIFDVGEELETRAPYIVMEFVGGQTLESLLSGDDHKLPVETALRLALELAEALDCAHGQGVVHRDLKPANILMTKDGHAKIADFGVAKLNLANQTLAGRALGTPAYMSPEQLNGEAVDGRSDLFSLGVVLYTALTGYRPFQGNSALTVSFKVVNRDPIPASLLDTQLPPGLDYIIARAMAKDPAERYQRGMEMVLDIQELRKGREPWSKAKLPGSSASNEQLRSSLGHPGIAAKLLLSARSVSAGQGIGGALLQKVRTRAFTGAALLAALLIFGFGLGLRVISFGPQQGPREAGPLPREVAPTKATAAPAAPVAVPPVATVPEAKALPKPVSAAPKAKALPKPLSEASKAKVLPQPVSANEASAGSKAPSPAMLEIEVDHKFAEAHLSIWVDNRLTYVHLLEGTDKKHLVLFHHVQGHELHAMEMSPGQHRLRVQVTSDEANYDQSATVEGAFASGQENLLRITFDKHGEINLSLQ
jgi:tRNA A-37 threonylcarbamoyl transferase component Bud32